MKKYLAIFAVVLAIATSAFTVSHRNATIAGNSYTYDLYGTADQDLSVNVNNPQNYTFAGTGSLPCSGTAHRCGVESAMDDGFGKPDFTKSYTIIKQN